MKILKTVLCLLLMGLTLSACSSPKSNNKWDKAEMAGIADPGFAIVSKTKTNSEIKYLFKDVDVAAANTFISLLYATEFTVDANYNYDTSSYSYAAYNSAGKSINFEYNPSERTASFTYALSGSSAFISGVRDMGYFIRANYEYSSDTDMKNYIASLYYSIVLNVKLTNQTDVITSCVLKNIKVKTGSRVGSLSISDAPYVEGKSVFTTTCSGTYDMNFIVQQNHIGTYPTTLPYSESKKAVFDAMSISQADLNFVITLTAEIQTSKGTYTKAYEIAVLPAGSDTTGMGTVYDVDKKIIDMSKGTPFTKQ
jgi:hypothetical protein